jgi:hypothetical protein
MPEADPSELASSREHETALSLALTRELAAMRDKDYQQSASLA